MAEGGENTDVTEVELSSAAMAMSAPQAARRLGHTGQARSTLGDSGSTVQAHMVSWRDNNRVGRTRNIRPAATKDPNPMSQQIVSWPLLHSLTGIFKPRPENIWRSIDAITRQYLPLF